MDKLDELIFMRFNIRSKTDNLPWMISKTRKGERINRRHLAQLFNEAGFKRGAEIGVRRGRFSMVLCEEIPELELFCIDPWSAYSNKYTVERQNRIYEEAVNNLVKFPNVKIIRKTSMEAVADFENDYLDFIHIDGDHTFDFVCPDIICWSKKVRKGGIVSVHDYYHFHLSGIVEAVDSYTKCHCISPWYVTKELEPTAFWVNP